MGLGVKFQKYFNPKNVMKCPDLYSKIMFANPHPIGVGHVGQLSEIL